MARWKRSHQSSAGTVLSGVTFGMSGVILLIMGAVALGVLLDTRDFTPKVGWAVVPAAAVWLTYHWRIFRAGVFVSDDALRVRTLFRTWTVPWQDISSFTVRPSKWGLGEGLWVIHKHGKSVETPVRRRGGPAYMTWRYTNQTYLCPADFELVLQALNRRIGR